MIAWLGLRVAHSIKDNSVLRFHLTWVDKGPHCRPVHDSLVLAEGNTFCQGLLCLEISSCIQLWRFLCLTEIKGIKSYINKKPLKMVWPKNLNAKVNQNVDGQTDGGIASIHKPELLCYLAKDNFEAKHHTVI